MEKNKTRSLSILYERWGLDGLQSKYDSKTKEVIEETVDYLCGPGLGKKYLIFKIPSGPTGPNFSFQASLSSSSNYLYL